MLVFFPLTAPEAQTTGIISIKNKRAPETFNINKYPVSAPTAEFLNEKGDKVSLRDFSGKIVLVNIWTTSCPQCVIELPMLDRLQKDMGGVKFQVIAISSDFEPLPLLRRFWVNRGIKNLKIYSDPQALFAQAADVKGLPTTFLIDEKGREVGRIRGITEWNGPKIKAQIRDLIRAAKENAKKEKEPAETASSNPTKSAESVSSSSIQRSKEIQSWFKK
ncbi:MAG: TlpA family protein disulfide reductase [Alphaproteobacteria bacterium]|nr:TlpA family protein disulfide reductase [Alphaproteobacteria bacterium]MBO4643339.1 TlpA family protein disulfide reductase [Alphaproteobacteria bacterium]